MEALVSGVLKSSESGCLVVSSEAEDAPDVVPVWPKGTKITNDSVTLPDGVVLKLGENVSLGGGFTTKGEYLSQAKKKCQSESVYLVCEKQSQ